MPTDRRQEDRIAASPAPRWLLPAVVYAVILGLSSIPGDRLDATGLPAWTSYLGHAAEYAVLGAALGWAAERLRHPLAVAVAVGALCGALDEVWQSTVPGRDPALLDWVVDVGAVTLAAVLVSRRPSSPS